MGEGFIVRRGGVADPILYDVVAQATEPAKKEDRIWVKTSVEMTIFAIQPTWTTGAVGIVTMLATPVINQPPQLYTMVRIFYNKRNGLYHKLFLQPTAIKQVQGTTGNWVNCDAWVCHDNAWYKISSAATYLFHSGGTDGVSWSAYGEYASLTKSSAALTCGRYSIGTTNKVDFSKYSTLKIDMTPTSLSDSGYGFKFGVTITPNNDANGQSFYKASAGATPTGAVMNQQYTIGTAPMVNGTRTTLSITIPSGAKGSYYLGFGIFEGNYTIHNVWLE